MKRVGLIGWRGMVGSVLMQRMLEERDFDLIEPVFFTTSNVGGQGPAVGKDVAPLKDAYNIDELKGLDVILKSSPSCAKPAGTATGSTRPPACAWPMTR
jgi:aspartate-semialdehyde dehydrogenase